jgi:hypothetical protein
MKKLRKGLMTAVEGVLWVTIFFLLFVLIYSIGLVALGIDPACAEVEHWPLAYVDVNADSYLNVRKTPAGELRTVRLESLAEVLVLDVEGGWALVIRPEHLGNGDMNGTPLGWVCMEYLRIYRDYMVAAK